MSDELDLNRSFEESSDMISYVFASIAYIREFFPDETFEDGRCAEMSLKKIRRGVNSHADRLLDWIDRGCRDALHRKFLETVTLGIFTDPEHPEIVLESYTISISYPSSKEHELINVLREPSANMTVKLAGEEKVIAASQNTSFTQQISRLLRTLCILMQTLKGLPAKKYASMQITYYDELTPRDYEPPGFTSLVFDLKYLFQRPTFKHDFGAAESTHHRVGITLETAADGLLEDSKNNNNNASVPKQEIVPIDDAEPTLTMSQPPLQDGNLTQETLVPDFITKLPLKIVESIIVDEKASTIKEKPVENVKIEEKVKVICLCGDSDNDLDMIVCDKCGYWQHTPCAGFCTNKDKRIPETYVCYKCQFRGNQKLLRNLHDLASFRRAISVVYSEGLENIRWLSKRLDCGCAKASRLVRRLETEGLVSKPNSQIRTFGYTVHKTPEAKEKIRHFFGTDLSAFPELRPFFFKAKLSPPINSNDNNTKTTMMSLNKKCPIGGGGGTVNNPPTKRRKSVTMEKVSCN